MGYIPTGHVCDIDANLGHKIGTLRSEWMADECFKECKHTGGLALAQSNETATLCYLVLAPGVATAASPPFLVFFFLPIVGAPSSASLD